MPIAVRRINRPIHKPFRRLRLGRIDVGQRLVQPAERDRRLHEFRELWNFEGGEPRAVRQPINDCCALLLGMRLVKSTGNRLQNEVLAGYGVTGLQINLQAVQAQPCTRHGGFQVILPVFLCRLVLARLHITFSLGNLLGRPLGPLVQRRFLGRCTQTTDFYSSDGLEHVFGRLEVAIHKHADQRQTASACQTVER